MAVHRERLEIVGRMLERLVKVLRDKIGEDLISVVLYGSYARVESTLQSDVDVLIIAHGLSPSSLERQGFFAKIAGEVESPFRPTFQAAGWFPYLSAILKTPEEAGRTSRIYFDMVEEARIVFDRDGFFRGVLQRSRSGWKSWAPKKFESAGCGTGI
jgi:predicted nucleotidyltransferase